MKILFLGQNPSTSAPDKSFLTTKSGDKLLHLIKLSNVPLDCVNFANVINEARPGNKSPKKSEFVKRGREDTFGQFLANFDIVYVCGEMAKVAVYWAREWFWLGKVKFVYIPHPSPRNRIWNDPEAFNRVSQIIGSEYESSVLKKMERD